MSVNEDFLSVDNPIPGQNFVCLSFVSPEKTLENKNIFKIHKFLKSVSEEYKLDIDKVTDKYDTYIYNNKDDIEKEFYEKNNFQTTVRGLKVRGVYDTKREAEVRAKVLQRQDKNFHVFVGQVGYWLPWDPEADDIEDQEYTESSLNKLVKKYNENKKKKDIFFDQQKQDSLNKIKEENKVTKISEIKEVEENLEKKYNNSNDNIMDMSDPWSNRKLEESISPLELKESISNKNDKTFLDIDK